MPSVSETHLGGGPTFRTLGGDGPVMTPQLWMAAPWPCQGNEPAPTDLPHFETKDPALIILYHLWSGSSLVLEEWCVFTAE